jgi:hypothetical protein
MLVNKSVLATQVLVQNGRANYFVRKLRAATIGTLILQPAILKSRSVKFLAGSIPYTRGSMTQAPTQDPH